jgi:transcriptional regulator with XRE-family HTH domain
MLEHLVLERKGSAPTLRADMTIHEEIKRLRKERGWSQTDLAVEVSKRLGLAKALTYQTVQQWENGSTAPQRKTLQAVADVLGTTPASLLAGGQHPMSFGDLRGPEAQLVMFFRQLESRPAASAALLREAARLADGGLEVALDQEGAMLLADLAQFKEPQERARAATVAKAALGQFAEDMDRQRTVSDIPEPPASAPAVAKPKKSRAPSRR